MVPAPTTVSTAALRAITLRLNSTPVSELPPIASHLAAGLLDCGDVLSQNVAAGKERSEAGLLVHKLKTRLSSLLQDRTVEGQWTAVVLIKAVIELGGWEVLKGAESWVQPLVGLLKKSNPSTTKRLSILTLTRIFSLTHQYPTLVREITTPLLPSFVTSCLNLISTNSPEGARVLKRSGAPLLGTILQTFLHLIPNHPTVFRAFASQIQTVLLPSIAPTTSSAGGNCSLSDNDTALAQQLLISLHYCAPKNTSSDEWASALRTTLASLHHTSDQIFRSVVEEWESSDPGIRQRTLARGDSNEVVSDGGRDPLGMPPWSGIHDGVERLIATLRLLANFIRVPTNSTVSLPVGALVDVTNRVTSVIGQSTENSLKTNPEIMREEREALFASLPSIHVETFHILSALVERLQNGALSVAHSFLEQVQWIFQIESYNKDIRSGSYTLLSQLLPLLGPSMSRKSVQSLTSVFTSCCNDLMELYNAATTSDSLSSAEKTPASQASQQTANADAFFTTTFTKAKSLSTITERTPYPQLLASASTLLPIILTHLPSHHLTPSVRTVLDRTAIITSQKDAMLASVLNPPSTKNGTRTAPSSILPFLARAFPGDPEVEALLRPRMPVLFTGRSIETLLGDYRHDTEDIDEDVAMNDYRTRGEGSGSSVDKVRQIREELDQQQASSGRIPMPQSDEDRNSTEEQDLLGTLSASLDMLQSQSSDLAASSSGIPLKRPLAPEESADPELSSQSLAPKPSAPLKKPRLDPVLSSQEQVPLIPPIATASVTQPTILDPITTQPGNPIAPSTNPIPSTRSAGKAPDTSVQDPPHAHNRRMTESDGSQSEDDEIPTLNVEEDTDEEGDE